MSTFFYTAIFFIVFILFLAESIYYLNKKERGNTPDKSPQTESRNLMFKIVIPIISVVIIIIAAALFLSVKKRSTLLPIALKPTPSPTSSHLLKSSLSPTSVSVPSPTVSSRLGNVPTGAKLATPSPTLTTSSAPIIYPKMPLAGSFRQTIIYILTGLSALTVGLLL